MTKVFISYRRDDSEFAVDTIYRKLAACFGPNSVFMDVDTVPKGVDFRQHINLAVLECDVLLVVIGKHWLDSRKENGTRRLDDPADFVRLEIEAALERDIPVIPVLLGGVSIPRHVELPAALGSLVYRNATELRRGKDFETHLDNLVQDIEFVAHQQSDLTSKSATVSPDDLELGFNRFVCPACAARFRLSRTMSIDSIHCPKCGQLSQVGDLHGRDRVMVPPNVETVSNSIGMQLALIPAGEFLMGSPETEEGRRKHEGPQHRVLIQKPFYMGVFPVTQDQFSRIMGTNPSQYSSDARLPVDTVSWEDAVEFCQKLSLLPTEKKTGRLYRLPTEAEWEYACRAGS